MTEKSDKMQESERVSEFYDGKSIFITGASGFLGTVLLECLLRCCPGIQTIYILMRSKRGKDVEERKQKLMEKTIFDPLKRENPDVLSKIVCLRGDITEPTFGMSDEDYDTIVERVSIVFHCAASIALDKPLQFILKRNTMSVDNVIQLCRKIKKLDVLVYTSSAYSNINRKLINECVYRLPFPAQTFIDAINEGPEELQSLKDQCYPHFPNTYTFSKCVAENILVEKAADLPLSIVRPSIIGCVLKTPVPGYIEDSSGLTNLSIAVGKGFARTIKLQSSARINMIRADAVANAHVLCAWIVGTGRGSSPFIANCAKTRNLDKVSDFARILCKMCEEKPLPNRFCRQTKHLIITDHGLIYKTVTFFQHYVPAYFIDTLLKLKGKRPMLVPLYRMYDEMVETLRKVMGLNERFVCDNYERIPQLLHSKDKEIFETDVNSYTVKEMAKVITVGSPFYDPKIDKRTMNQRQKIANQRYWALRFIKTAAILSFIATVYLAFSLVNQVFQAFFV